MPNKKTCFVFGSNLAGNHGAGAAKYAALHYQAEIGVGIGPTGNAYALPTKDEKLRRLSLDKISFHLKMFLKYAEKNEDTIFILTPIATGFAGYSRKQVLDILKFCQIPDNVVFSKQWMPGHENDVDSLL